jgi:hypothetical protein
VSLHIDAGVSCPSRSYDLGGSRVFAAGACPGVGPTMNAIEPPESRIGTFHVAGFSPSCGSSGGENGVANFLGAKMVIFTEGTLFAHVLMHELGHNLGLDHQFGYQPNRFSSMNTVLNTSPNGNTATETIDFQRFSVPALDENNLSEVNGISAPPEAHQFFVMHYCEASLPSPTFPYAWPGDGSIDWNCCSTRAAGRSARDSASAGPPRSRDTRIERGSPVPRARLPGPGDAGDAWGDRRVRGAAQRRPHPRGLRRRRSLRDAAGRRARREGAEQGV